MTHIYSCYHNHDELLALTLPSDQRHPSKMHLSFLVTFQGLIGCYTLAQAASVEKPFTLSTTLPSAPFYLTSTLDGNTRYCSVSQSHCNFMLTSHQPLCHPSPPIPPLPLPSPKHKLRARIYFLWRLSCRNRRFVNLHRRHFIRHRWHG